MWIFIKHLKFYLQLHFSMLNRIKAQNSKGLAKTPPMGWNSWNKFAKTPWVAMLSKFAWRFVETADAMAASGMKDAGYEYVVIDDCWQIGRDSLGFIVAVRAFSFWHQSPCRLYTFKVWNSGFIPAPAIKPVAVAGSRGYKISGYVDVCQMGRWLSKYDWCYTEHLNAGSLQNHEVRHWNRPDVRLCSVLCEWGGNKPWLWAKEGEAICDENNRRYS